MLGPEVMGSCPLGLVPRRQPGARIFWKVPLLGHSGALGPKDTWIYKSLWATAASNMLQPLPFLRQNFPETEHQQNLSWYPALL